MAVLYHKWDIIATEMRVISVPRGNLSGYPTAKGFVFLTLEDEWGLINVIVRPDVFQSHRAAWADSLVLVVEGTVQRSDGAANVLAEAAGRVR